MSKLKKEIKKADIKRSPDVKFTKKLRWTLMREFQAFFWLSVLVALLVVGTVAAAPISLVQLVWRNFVWGEVLDPDRKLLENYCASSRLTEFFGIDPITSSDSWSGPHCDDSEFTLVGTQDEDGELSFLLGSSVDPLNHPAPHAWTHHNTPSRLWLRWFSGVRRKPKEQHLL